MNSSASQSSSEVVQRLQRERRVAHPGVAVVPIALAAGSLGQRGRQRRHGRAGRHVGQPLDRQRRALQSPPPAMVGNGRARPSQRARTGRSRRSARPASSTSRDRHLLPKTARSSACSPWRSVCRARTVALDPECAGQSGQPDRLAGAARVRGAAGPSTSVHSAGVAAVVERRLADQFDLDLALEALDCPHEHVVGVLVGGWACMRRVRGPMRRRPDRQRVVDHDPASRRLPGRLEDVRSWHVVAVRRAVHAERGQAERAACGPAASRTRSGASNRGRHSHSTDPSGATSAPVWQSDRNAYSAIGGNGDGAAALWTGRSAAVLLLPPSEGVPRAARVLFGLATGLMTPPMARAGTPRRPAVARRLWGAGYPARSGPPADASRSRPWPPGSASRLRRARRLARSRSAPPAGRQVNRRCGSHL